MDLSLDLSLVYVPKTMSEFTRDISKTKNISAKVSKIDDFVKRLEDERRKIDAFRRELPLCMLLLTDVIARLEEEKVQYAELNDRSAVEEILPLKRISEEDGAANRERDGCDKKNWMSSVQLWSNNVNPDPEQHSISRLKSTSEDDGSFAEEHPVQPSNHSSRGGAIGPFKGKSGFQEKGVPSLSLMTPISELSSCTTVSASIMSCRVGFGSSLCADQNPVKLQSKPQHQQQQNSRKQRRCWSPELHRRFVEALQKLGGSKVATPKQIRELMQVDGLTNDEVKSHLQKYRLHIRKVPASSSAAATSHWSAGNHSGDSSKPSISPSGSPQGPLLSHGADSNGADSMETEEDEKSDGRSWRGRIHRPEEIHVYN